MTALTTPPAGEEGERDEVWELARYLVRRFEEDGHGSNVPTTELMLARALLSSPRVEEVRRMREALEKIARWHGEFPSTGKFWDKEETQPMSYSACFGSNGERDFMREIALAALPPSKE